MIYNLLRYSEIHSRSVGQVPKLVICRLLWCLSYVFVMGILLLDEMVYRICETESRLLIYLNKTSLKSNFDHTNRFVSLSHALVKVPRLVNMCPPDLHAQPCVGFFLRHWQPRSGMCPEVGLKPSFVYDSYLYLGLTWLQLRPSRLKPLTSRAMLEPLTD